MMKLNTVRGNIQESTADTIIVNLFEGVTIPSGATGAVDKALSGAISELIASGDLTGKANQVVVVYSRGAILAKRVIVVGLGKPDKLTLEGVRLAAAHAIKRARDLNAKDVATIVHGAGTGGVKLADATRATVEGSVLALYRSDLFHTQGEKKNEIQSLTVVESAVGKKAEVESAVKLAETVLAGTVLARDLTNLPPNMATPSKLASVAQEIAKTYKMKLTIGDREWAAEHKMGAFLAVAQGANEPPRFIVLEHNSDRTDLDTIVLVGKGITFDSGGISLKPAERMGDMKSDMAGAAAVLATMKVVGMLNIPLHIVAITPCTENMPSGHAYHPADIITASNGKTIEIISTDAEGRMILADALVYAGRYQPKFVIDLATLTGACVIALGQTAAGIFCTHDELCDKLVASGQAVHERVWPLPLWDDYKTPIKSLVADMLNSGGRNNGVSTSAMFLKEFTDYPWAHIDIAGMVLFDKKDETAYVPMGGTGFGVRLLVEFLCNW